MQYLRGSNLAILMSSIDAWDIRAMSAAANNLFMAAFSLSFHVFRSCKRCSHALSPVQLAKDGDEPLHHSQHDCSPQEGRRLGYQPPPFDQTPCYLNEKTCTKHYAHTSWGSNITITFDWKHMMYEDYDRALFARWDREGGPHYLFTSPGQAGLRRMFGHHCKRTHARANLPACIRVHVLHMKHLAHAQGVQALHGAPKLEGMLQAC